MTPIVCRCFHIFASERTGAKWERFSIPVKSSTRSQDRRKQVVEPSVVSKRGATFMCFEARLSSPCEGVAFDRCPKTKIPSCARRSTLHATVAAAHPACLCAPSTPTTSPGRTDGEDRREQTEKRTQKPKHAGPALPTVHATVAAAHPACLCALKQRRTAPGTAAARTVKIKQFPPVPPAHRARKQYQAALRTVNTARAATRRPRLRTLKRQNDLTRELPAHRHRNSRSYRRP